MGHLPKGRGIVLPEPDAGRLPNDGSEEVATPTSITGVVEAILEVSRHRKKLLDQLRSALESGNDAEALRFARELCGLQDGRKQ
jgi:hypothetical protein